MTHTWALLGTARRRWDNNGNEEETKEDVKHTTGRMHASPEIEVVGVQDFPRRTTHQLKNNCSTCRSNDSNSPVSMPFHQCSI